MISNGGEDIDVGSDGRLGVVMKVGDETGVTVGDDVVGVPPHAGSII